MITSVLQNTACRASNIVIIKDEKAMTREEVVWIWVQDAVGKIYPSLHPWAAEINNQTSELNQSGADDIFWKIVLK